MTIEVNKKEIFSEFEWLIRVLDSSETKGHLETVQNCFRAWEKKHSNQKLDRKDQDFLRTLKIRYWARFKNKIFLISPFDLELEKFDFI